MSDNESDVSGIHDWALVEHQDSTQDSEGSNDFVCVSDNKSVSYHHRPSTSEAAALEEDNDDELPMPPIPRENVSTDSSPTAESSSVTDSITMTAAVAQDEADSVTSSCSLEELAIPAEEDMLSHSSSSLEVLSLPAEDLVVDEIGQQYSAMERSSKEDLNGSRGEEQMECSDWQPLDPVRSLLNSVRMRRPSGSDTDHSDFVRLDPSQSDDVAGGDTMNLSSASSLTASSSVSSTFRFIHRSGMVLGEEPARRVYYRDNDEDSVQSDVDDRCESDISGVAGDDSDLSNLTYSLGDVPIAAGNVARSYKHRPNNSLNAILTTTALVALFFAVGIGLGDFIGFHRQAGLRLQQVSKLRSLQDDYLVCLEQQEQSAQMLDQQQKDNEMIQAVTEEWKQQYDELILERVSLESQIDELQMRMKADSEAGRQILEEMEGSTLSQLIDGLEHQNMIPSQMNTALVSTDVEEPSDTSEGYSELISQDEGDLEQQKDIKTISLRKYFQKLLKEKKNTHRTCFTIGQSLQQESRTNVVTRLQKEVDTLSEEKGELVFRMSLMEHDIMTEKDEVLLLKKELQEKLSVNITAQLQHEVDVLKNEKDELLFKIDLMRYDVLGEKQMLQELQDAAKEKLERFHQLSFENADLRKEVARLRYSEHPGNSLNSLATDGDKNTDDLKSEISKLKQEVTKLQRKLVSMSENLQRETKLAFMWQERFVQKCYQLDEVLKTSPDFAKCLSLIIPAVTFKDLSDVSSDALKNISYFVTNQIEVIQKLADDSEFLARINAKWGMLRSMLHSPFTEEVKDQTMAAYEDIRKTVVDKFESLGGAMFGNSFSDNSNVNLDSKEEEINSYHTRLHRMVNQTKETVTKLTKKINQTWEKVKDVSGHVANKVVSDVVPVVKENVEKLTGKVQHGWDTVKKKVQTGLLNKKGKKNKHKRKEDHVKGERPSETKRGMSEEDLKQYHGDPYKNDLQTGFDETVFTQTSHQFEHKPEHKQKTSDIHVEKAPQNKFWDKVGFNPDVLLHDDFFEGNERKWRKHQKVLKKLHGRINRLNEDVLHDMDDDDIEDLYEDLEDFQEDLEDEAQPMGLQTWLTCQVRWWKGRFQRKHRSEDLIKGCGRQLMHWQVKASCEVKGHGKRLVSMPVCLQYFPHRSVIRTVANDASFNGKKKRHHSRKTAEDCSKKHKGKRRKGYTKSCKNEKEYEEETHKIFTEHFLDDPVLPFGMSKDKEGNSLSAGEIVPNNTLDDKSAEWWFQIEQHRENHHVSGDWYWRHKSHQYVDIPMFSEESWMSGAYEDVDSDSDWYFSRAEAHEFYHHDPRWIFRRAKERDFHRNKPWYVARAEKRNDGHQKYKDN